MDKGYNEFKNIFKSALENKYGKGQIEFDGDKENESFKITSSKVSDEMNFLTDAYFIAYNNGENIETLVEEIDGVLSSTIEKYCVDDKLDIAIDRIKDSLVFSIRNLGDYRIDNLMYDELEGGMAKIYELEVDMYNKISITKEMAKDFNLDSDLVREIAEKNTERLYPATFESVFDVRKYEPQDRTRLNNLETCDFSNREWYIFSNTENLQGAAALYYEGAAEKIGKWLEDDYYIVPCSIHELMVVPASFDNLDLIEDLLNSANEEVVKPYDVLGSRVLKYNRLENKIGIAREMETELEDETEYEI